MWYNIYSEREIRGLPEIDLLPMEGDSMYTMSMSALANISFNGEPLINNTDLIRAVARSMVSSIYVDDVTWECGRSLLSLIGELGMRPED
jgi:hypothetical protein